MKKGTNEETGILEINEKLEKLKINETIRLYDADAYAVDFEATVISCEKIQKKKEISYEVILDRTLFFPEEGGQSPDMGQVGGHEVQDVQIHKGIITHTLKEPLEPGSRVSGKVDWIHRFYNMQQHSGEHIFSGIVHTRFGYDNVGFHLSDQIVTLDFNGPMTAEEVASVEFAANEAIIQNIAIGVSYPSKEELKKLSYRSKKEIEGQVRIVTIPGYDVCACCAPHVGRTGEIGMLKVMNLQNYKGGVRISILCGFRALQAFREKNEVVAGLMNLLTTGQDKLMESVSRMKNTNAQLSSQLAVAKKDLLSQKLQKIPEEQKNVLLFEQGLDAFIARNAVNTLMQKHSGLCGIFSGSDEEGYTFIIGSSQYDCRKIAASMRQTLNARGGGSSQMIQGSVKADSDAIRTLWMTM